MAVYHSSIVALMLIVVTSAASVSWASAGNGRAGAGQFPSFPFPGFPIQPPALPNFPNIRPPQFPSFPQIPVIPPFSPADILNRPVDPNSNYNGIAVHSSSQTTRDKDGNIVRTGGTTVVTNDNGDVKTFTTGDSPPDVGSVNADPPKIVLPTPPKITLPTLPWITLPTPPFLPINPFAFAPTKPEDIKNFKPSENGHFFGTSTSAFMTSSNVDGVETHDGAVNTVVNVDGDVTQKTVILGGNDEENEV